MSKLKQLKEIEKLKTFKLEFRNSKDSLVGELITSEQFMRETDTNIATLLLQLGPVDFFFKLPEGKRYLSLDTIKELAAWIEQLKSAGSSNDG